VTCSVALLCGDAVACPPGRELLEALRAISDDLLLCVGVITPSSLGGLAVLAPCRPGSGVLGGIHAALAMARHDEVLALAADGLPPPPRLLRRLLEHPSRANAVVLLRGAELLPLPGLYRRQGLKILRRALREGRATLPQLLEDLRATRILEEPGGADPGVESQAHPSTENTSR